MTALPPPGDPAAAPALSLTLPRTIGSLEAARQAVVQLLAAHGVGARAVYSIELVLEELLMNQIMHAEDARADIGLRAAVKADSVVLSVEDDGAPFDPLQRPAAPAPASLTAADIGGLGLGLVRKVSQQLDYQRRDGRNVLTATIARA